MKAIEFRAVMTNVHAAGGPDYELRSRRFQHLVKDGLREAGIEFATDGAANHQDCWWLADLHMEIHDQRRHWDEQALEEMYSVVTYLGVVRNDDVDLLTSTITNMGLGTEFPHSAFRFVNVPGQPA